jgi:hypothetical protein
VEARRKRGRESSIDEGRKGRRKGGGSPAEARDEIMRGRRGGGRTRETRRRKRGRKL